MFAVRNRTKHLTFFYDEDDYEFQYSYTTRSPPLQIEEWGFDFTYNWGKE
jgi:hypothetical protein